MLSLLATSFFTFETKKRNLFDNRVYVTAKVTIILDRKGNIKQTHFTAFDIFSKIAILIYYLLRSCSG